MSPKPGDLVVVDMGLHIGHEQAGIRPAIFLHAEGNVSLVIPLSSNAKRLRFDSTVQIEPDDTNMLTKSFVALVFQMRAIDSRRIGRSIGSLSAKSKREINAKVRTIALLR